MTNTQELFKMLDIRRDTEYITIDKNRNVIRVMVPDTKVKRFNIKNYSGKKAMTKMTIDALNHRDEARQQRRLLPTRTMLFAGPIKELSKKHNIRQSSRGLFSELNSPDIESIVVRGYIDDTYVKDYISLKDFEGLEKDPFYYAHYCAAYIRNNSFELGKLPTEAIKKNARKWALDTKSHLYQHMTDSEYEAAISEYKKG